MLRIAVFVAIVASCASAQSDSSNGGVNAPTRTCIAVPVNLSHLTINPTVERAVAASEDQECTNGHPR